jgi:hypothetical protein
MSVPSSKTTVTDEIPSCETLRISAHARHAAHPRFDRKGHIPFHFQRRKPPGLGDDLNLGVGHVGDRVDGKIERGIDPQRGHQEREQDHEASIAQGFTDEFFEHDRTIPVKERARREDRARSESGVIPRLRGATRTSR